ncbi:hypothetical protein C5Z26_00530 [Lactobacillus sp. CBA3606]|uniref:hypothetical protein n=1 Tax=Lactobacillus sp. CBA3606 TaxID=2099789 RepID=UPI000CFC552B|nr:hypothetical protein [Lactobacillus sp. CBA3606]AVK62715.1 hypothetical protein C5Z26_00530 [Lactobacillus sp. CBA3606]
MDQVLLDERKNRQEKFFLGLYGVNLVAWFINYSMLNTMIPELAKYMAVFNVLAFFVYVFMGFQIDEKVLWLCSLFLFCTLVSYYTSRDVVIIGIGILIFTSQGIKRKKILQEYVVISIVMTSAIFILSQVGIIQDLVFIRGGVERHAFGSIQPTILSAQLFSLCVAVACLKYKTIKYFEIISMVVLATVCYWYLNARNDTVFILLIVITLLLGKWKVKIRFTVLRDLMVFLMPILSLGVYSLAVNYDASNTIMSRLNDILSSRLQLSNIAIFRYPIKLFGQKTIENGNGGGTQIATNNYFFIDSSYLRLLLRYGVVLFVFVLTLYMITMAILLMKNEYTIFVLLVIMSIQVMWEQSLMSVCNVFIFYMLMDTDDYHSLYRIVKYRSQNFFRFIEE